MPRVTGAFVRTAFRPGARGPGTSGDWSELESTGDCSHPFLDFLIAGAAGFVLIHHPTIDVKDAGKSERCLVHLPSRRRKGAVRRTIGASRDLRNR